MAAMFSGRIRHGLFSSALPNYARRAAAPFGWRVIVVRDAIPAAGCYAIYHDGELVYIGSSARLTNRIATYLNPKPRATRRPVINSGARQRGAVASVVVKVKPSRRAGDWLMREYRLILRLKPRDNRQFTGSLARAVGRPARPTKACLGCGGTHQSVRLVIVCEALHKAQSIGKAGFPHPDSERLPAVPVRRFA